MESGSQDRIRATLLLTLAAFAGGLGAGYYFWAGDDQRSGLWGEAATTNKGSLSVPLNQRPTSAEDDARSLRPFEKLESEVIQQVTARNYAAAIELVVDLDLIAASEEEADQVSALLEETVKLRVVQLESRRQFSEIDGLYESLTFAMPERAEYYLLLAERRIKMGDPAAALPVLSQIENHGQLGGRARELIKGLSEGTELAPLAATSLIKRGDQYLVRITVDNSRQATLLLDTGASMTILAPALLRKMGYSLDGEQASFSTAGGLVVAPVVIIDSLNLGEARVSPLKVGALDLGRRDGQVDGLLGMDYLAQFEFSLDQDEGILNLMTRR